MSTTVRRIVTGHDARGHAIIQSDAPPERVMTLPHNGPTFYEIWNTRESPARIDRSSGEPPETGITLAPPRHGTRIRVLDFPPETGAAGPAQGAQARELFAAIGAAGALNAGPGQARHPHMHRTETVDYGIVLDGEITLLVDDGETVVRAGDIVIQRGTNHGWANRSGRNCRVAFILIDGKFEDGLG
jgi:mannose-6-phosphate isomerase-like protein (cupin superfamily)